MPTATSITACILARNEEERIAPALRSIQGWTERIIVIDNESEDNTVEVARRYTDCLLTAPAAVNFDAARNLAEEHAAGDWLLFLDADERVPAALARRLTQLVATRGDEFSGFEIPCRHHFCGRWLRQPAWWPGYKGPQLLRKGSFRFRDRIHGGIEVRGPTLRLPADDPELAIVHESYPDLPQYFRTLNRFTTAEAENLYSDGLAHDWRSMVAHFVQDWHLCYDRGKAYEEGMHGFLLAFLSAYYRFAARAKLWDLRRTRDELQTEEAVPHSATELFAFLREVALQGPGFWLAQSIAASPDRICEPDEPHAEIGRAPSRPYRPRVPAPITVRILPGDGRGEAEDTVRSVKSWVRHVVRLDGPDKVSTGVEASATHEASDGDWILLLQAGERVSPDLARELVGQLRKWDEDLRAVFLPEYTEFLGKGLRAGLLNDSQVALPRLVKRGYFTLTGTKLQSMGFRGRALYLEAAEDSGTLLYPGFSSLESYLTSLGTETEIAAGGLDRTVGVITWDALLAAWSEGFRDAYDAQGAAHLGMPGFILAFHTAMRRWLELAMLWDQRRREGHLQDEAQLPGSVAEMLRFIEAPPRSAPAPVDHVRPSTTEVRERVPRAPVDLTGIPAHYRLITGTSPLVRLLDEVLKRSGSEGRVLETGGEFGYASIWLSHRGVSAEGLHPSPAAVEQARTINTLLAGKATFRQGDPLQPTAYNGLEYDVIFHQTSGEKITEEKLRQLLGQQLEHAKWVIFTIRTEPAGPAPDTRRHRRPEWWHEILAPLPVEALHRLVETPAGESEDRLVILRGQLQEPRDNARSAWEPGTAPKISADRAGDAPRRLPPNPVVLDPVPTVDLRKPLGRPIRVRWEAELDGHGNLPSLSRDLILRLKRDQDLILSLPGESLDASTPAATSSVQLAEPSDAAPDLTVRHSHHLDWRRPATGKLVVVIPWAGGVVPEGRISGAAEVDEIWVHSRFIRDTFVRRGVPAERIRLVPPGVDPVLFSPKRAPLPLPTGKQIRFLMLGATDHNCLEFLLAAYERAFHATDDVTLIAADVEDPGIVSALQRFASRAESPEVQTLDQRLDLEEKAALYRSCTCLISLCSENAALSPLEAMASGIPLIVAAGGPAEDYGDDQVALRVPSRRIAVCAPESLLPGAEQELWTLAPDLEALTDALRWVRDHPEQNAERGRAARDRVLQGWTWERTAAVIRSRLDVLLTTPVVEAPTPVRFRGANKNARPSRSGKGKPLLSLCMIARNEEPRIGECLRSAAPYVDEMVLVDTGSTDRTREIAAECGARVWEMPWPQSFATARNASLDLARGRWIFWMDADDVLPSECGKKLRSLISESPAAYHVSVRIPAGPGEFSPSLVDHVKLFPNRPDLRFDFRIHEQILPALRQAGVPVHFSDLYVIHQNYDRSDAGQTTKRIRDFQLLELDLRERPDHPFVLYNLGMTYLYATRDYAVAAHYLRRCLEGSDPGASIVRKAYAMLVTAHLRREEWELALDANERGRGFYPNDAELLFQAAQLYQRVGRMKEAGKAFQRLLEGTDDPHYRSVDASLRTYRGRHELALWRQRVGDPEGCERILREIIAAQPDYTPAQDDLQALLVHRGGPTTIQTQSGR